MLTPENTRARAVFFHIAYVSALDEMNARPDVWAEYNTDEGERIASQNARPDIENSRNLAAALIYTAWLDWRATQLLSAPPTTHGE